MTHRVHMTIQGRIGDLEAVFETPPRPGDQVLVTDPSIGASEFRTVEAAWHAAGALGHYDYWIRLGPVVAPG